MSTPNTLGSLNIPQVPLDSAGKITLSLPWQKFFQSLQKQAGSALNNAGQVAGTIAAGATVENREGTVGAALQNVDSNGVVAPAGISAATSKAQGAVILPAGATSNQLGSASISTADGFDVAGSAQAAENAANAFTQAFASNASNLATGTVPNKVLGGVSGSVTLIKLTALGVNGSLTFVNGLITAFTAPT